MILCNNVKMTRKALLPDLSGQEFLKLHRREKNARGKIRLLALHHLQQGSSISNVCRILCVTSRTIYSWLSWYKSGGLPRLLSKPMGRGSKKKARISANELQAGISKLQDSRNGGRVIADDIIDWIDSVYGVRYSKGHIYNLLKNAGISWVSVRSKHPKHNAEEQNEFKKNL